MAAIPTAADLAEWLKIDPATAGLDDAMTTALEVQAAACIVEPYAEPLRIAAIRRAAREFTSRPFTMGITDVGEFGVARVGRDPLIAELEADYRRGAFA